MALTQHWAVEQFDGNIGPLFYVVRKCKQSPTLPEFLSKDGNVQYSGPFFWSHTIFLSRESAEKAINVYFDKVGL